MGDTTEKKSRTSRKNFPKFRKRSIQTAYNQRGKVLAGSSYRNLLPDNRSVISDLKLFSPRLPTKLRPKLVNRTSK